MTLTHVFDNLSGSRQETSANVVETSVSVITNSPSRDNTHGDDYTSPSYKIKIGTAQASYD